MTQVPHQLLEEFPEHAQRIEKLRLSDAKFEKKLADYSDVNMKVFRAESEVRPTDDFHLENMKKLRLVLKDELFAMLSDG